MAREPLVGNSYADDSAGLRRASIWPTHAAPPFTQCEAWESKPYFSNNACFSRGNPCLTTSNF